MSTTIITAFVGLFCTLASSIVTFFLTRKKYNEEVTSQKLDNVTKSFDILQKMYRATTDTQNEKIEKLQEENEKLKKEVWNLRQEMAELLPYICNTSNCSKRRLSSSSVKNFEKMNNYETVSK